MTCFSVKVRPLKNHKNIDFYNFVLLGKVKLKKTDDAKNNPFPSCSFLLIYSFCNVAGVRQQGFSS